MEPNSPKRRLQQFICVQPKGKQRTYRLFSRGALVAEYRHMSKAAQDLFLRYGKLPRTGVVQ